MQDNITAYQRAVAAKAALRVSPLEREYGWLLDDERVPEPLRRAIQELIWDAEEWAVDAKYNAEKKKD